MGRLSDLIDSLLNNSDGNAYQRRLRFFNDPLGYCSDPRYDLNDEQIAVLFTMNPRRIHNYILPNEGVDLYRLMKQYEGQMDYEAWPDPGSYTYDPWSTEPPSCDGPSATTSSGEIRIMWSVPTPGVQEVLTRTARLGQPFDLKISGEGFMPGASIELVQQHIVFRFRATHFHQCSFRRSYLRAKIGEFPKFLPTGDYEVRVHNPEGQVEYHARQRVSVS